MEPVPSLQDVIFMLKTAKNGVKVENTKIIFFSNFFFEINAKFDADFNGTGPEPKRRLLRGQNLKNPAERVKKLESFFFQIFFL